MLAGNHDLETNDSVFSANAAASLQSIGVNIVCGPAQSVKIDDVTVHFISWRNSHAELLADMKSLRESWCRNPRHRDPHRYQQSHSDNARRWH
jgi:hypothetical protein